MSAYQFDSIKSFDELRIALRRIERQHAKLPSKVTKTVGCRSAQDKEKKTEKEDKQEKSELAKLKASIQQLTAEMSDIKKQQSEYVLQKKPAVRRNTTCTTDEWNTTGKRQRKRQRKRRSNQVHVATNMTQQALLVSAAARRDT